MAITNFDGIINARASGNAFDNMFAKTGAVGGVSGAWYSAFLSAGYPAAFTQSAFPGTNPNNTTTGAIPILTQSSTATQTEYLLTAGFSTPSVVGYGALMLVDILWAGGGLSASSAVSQTISSSALTRYTSGNGVMIALEPTTALGATAQNLTITYTNQAGSSKTTPATAMVVSSAGQRLSCFSNNLGPFFPLAAGDIGVKSIQSGSFSAANTAGILNVYLVKPLMIIPTVAAQTWVERDSTTQIDGLLQLPLGSDNNVGCLAVFGLTGGTTTTTFTGFVRTCWG
jgi:hypothetical protein